MTYEGWFFSNGDHYSVEERHLSQQEAIHGGFCRLIPFKNADFPGNIAALRVPLRESREATARLRQEIRVFEHISRQLPENCVNLGKAFGADTAGATNIVLERYRSAYRLDDQRLRRLDILERLRIGAEFFTGVDSLARLGIVHQDICPSNVLVTVGPERLGVRIVDFGHAFVDGQPRTNGEQVAHAEWSHPSRTAGGPATPYTDLWESLLSWLYLLTGNNLQAELDDAATRLPVSLPAGLSDTIQRGLVQARGEDRHAAGEIARAMRRALDLVGARVKVREKLRKKPPESGFEWLDVAREDLGSTIDETYRISVRRWMGNDLAQAGSKADVERVASALSEGNTLGVSTLFRKEVEQQTILRYGGLVFRHPGQEWWMWVIPAVMVIAVAAVAIVVALAG